MEPSLCSSYRQVRNSVRFKKLKKTYCLTWLVLCCVSLRVEPLLLSAILISDSESKCTNTRNKPSAHFYPALFLSPHPRQAPCWHCHIISVSFVPPRSSLPVPPSLSDSLLYTQAKATISTTVAGRLWIFAFFCWFVCLGVSCLCHSADGGGQRWLTDVG